MNRYLTLVLLSFTVSCAYSAPIFYVGDTDDIFPESSDESLMPSLWSGNAYGKRVGKRGDITSEESAEDRLLSSILASRFGIEGKRSEPMALLPDDEFDDNQLLATLWANAARRGRGKRGSNGGLTAAQLLSRPVRLARIIRQFKVPSAFQNMLNYHIY